MSAEELATAAAAVALPEEEDVPQQPDTSAVTGLQQLRRVRRARTQYEKLQRPPGIEPGSPLPSIEGWVLFLTNLPEETTAEDVQDLFASFKTEDPAYFGTVRDVRIPLDRDCHCPGHALVELDTEEGFRRACAELAGAPIPFYAEEGAEPRLLGVAPAFLAEEDEPAPEEEEAAAGEKRTRDD